MVSFFLQKYDVATFIPKETVITWSSEPVCTNCIDNSITDLLNLHLNLLKNYQHKIKINIGP